MSGDTELRADRFAYILTENNRLMLGGGSSTKPQVRIYSSYHRARQMRGKHFSRAEIMRVEFHKISDANHKILSGED